MVQVPAATMATVFPETVHTAAVRDEKTTALPDAPPVALIANAASPKTLSASTVKVMFCAALPTVKLCVTRGAGL